MDHFVYCMLTTFGTAGMVIYIIVMLVSLHESLKINQKYHSAKDEGLLDFIFNSHTTYDKREATTKDVWKALLWPLAFMKLIGKCFLWVFNEMLVIFLLALGFRYKNTTMYKKLDSLTTVL